MAFNSSLENSVTMSNTANVDSPIWKYEVPDSSVVDFPTKQPVQMKLYNSTGDEIADTSLVWFAVKVPYKKIPEAITKPLLYRWFKNLTPAQQADINTMIMMEADDKFMDSPLIRIRQARVIYLYVDSPDVVDWTQGSYFNLEQTELRGAD